MGKLTLTYKGESYWGNVVYENNGRYYADLNSDGIKPELYSLSLDELDGEPDMPISKDIEVEFNPERVVIDNDKRFQYSMLDMLRLDCDYYLGCGNRNLAHLTGGSVKEHIDAMKERWTSFPEGEKPEWLTWEGILDYEEKMMNPEQGK